MAANVDETQEALVELLKSGVYTDPTEFLKLGFSDLDVAIANSIVSYEADSQRNSKVSSPSSISSSPSPHVRKSITNSLDAVQISLAIPYEKLQYSSASMVGKGSFGEVYKGTWMDSEVAIKLLSPTAVDPRIYDSFIREMEIMVHLAHPHIVQLFGISEIPGGQGKFLVVTEFLEKGSLSNLLFQCPKDIPWTFRFSFARGIICALKFLHSQHIWHRDIKSDNVMLTGDYKVKLIDFGLAAFGKSHERFSEMDGGAAAGSPLWMSPEMLQYIEDLREKKENLGKEQEIYTDRSDIFSLGIVMNEIASRKKPYFSFPDIKSMSLLFDFVVTKNKRDIVPPHTPLFFSKIIQDCWKKNPTDRPAAAGLIEEFDSKAKEYTLNQKK